MSAGTDAANSDCTGLLAGLLGKHMIYAYENGWKYELYVRNADTVATRCLLGPMFGRWTTNQTAKIVSLGGAGADPDEQYKLAWVEPTGSTMVAIVWPGERRVHTTATFPQWMLDYPESTLTHYEDNLHAIRADRDRGPTYPLTLVSSNGRITYLESRDPDDDTVIDCPPSKLPVGYADRMN
ncbi:phenolic acid decarboxylase [Nocardia sp. NPDC005978]|uniref:phenolic acid decarboxylase n=1 Tax=Nocardia sp. NPDC005978 TaxID=3156725 RepID=UPI0033B825F3